MYVRVCTKYPNNLVSEEATITVNNARVLVMKKKYCKKQRKHNFADIDVLVCRLEVTYCCCCAFCICLFYHGTSSAIDRNTSMDGWMNGKYNEIKKSAKSIAEIIDLINFDISE